MTTTVRDICRAMEAWAPPSLAYDWDRAGLSVGDPDATVKRVLVCLTVTQEAFRRARRSRAQMLVSHHPLIWEPLKTLRSDEPYARLCLDVASAGMAAFSAHTNLDVMHGGVNHVLAERLKLVNTKPLLPATHASQMKLVTFVPESHLARVRDAVCGAGAGVIGEYTHCSFSAAGKGTFRPGNRANPFSGRKAVLNEEPELRFETLVPEAQLAPVLAALRAAHPYEEVAYDLVVLREPDPAVGLGLRGELVRSATLGAFARAVRERLGLSHVRMVGMPSQRVVRVAVLGGAGGSSIGQLPGDIDVMVTGDVGYHDACLARARGIGLIDAGHAGTELPIVPAISRYLRSRFTGLSVESYREPDLFTVS